MPGAPGGACSALHDGVQLLLGGLLPSPLPGFSTAKHRWNRMWFYFHFTDELCCMGGLKAQIHGAIYFLWKGSQWELNSFRPLNTFFVVRGLAECCRSQGALGGIRNSHTHLQAPHSSFTFRPGSSNPVPGRAQVLGRSDRRDLDTSPYKQLRKQIFPRKGFLPSAG